MQTYQSAILNIYSFPFVSSLPNSTVHKLVEHLHRGHGGLYFTCFHIFLSNNFSINKIIRLSPFFPPCLVIYHDTAVEFNGSELMFEPHGDGLGPQRHAARNKTQPGSLDDDRLRRCSSVIHPLQMMTVTFHIIMKTTFRMAAKRLMRTVSNWWSAKIVLEKSPELFTTDYIRLHQFLSFSYLIHISMFLFQMEQLSIIEAIFKAKTLNIVASSLWVIADFLCFTSL